MTVASMPMWSAVTRSILLRRGGDAAEEVAAADHEADLDAGGGHLGDLAGQLAARARRRCRKPAPPASASPLSFSRMRL